ncbi:MAG: SDR family NAD(P)-dependent oxidoreductase [Clostridiales bacterium]|jgi:NAD(P)-dependent dehydrogenase (short-subunit alcohol dehydrogenase family)|nr:SDR family NAD(P)-dependent oxidoreductase [Clostridiales bacterium]
MIDLSSWKKIAADKVNSRDAAPGRLSGKIAVVTGGAQGLGRGICEGIYKEGASVVIADINRDEGEKFEKALGGRAKFIYTNVTDEESVANLMAETVSHFGGIDLLISNAGVLRAGPLGELECADFEFVTRVNYIAYFICAKYASEIMKAQHEANPDWRGDIIEINSKSGLAGSNKNSAYAGSKFGGIGLTASFALELCEYNIKVNAICPGNYLDGPLWTNPENGLFVQYLKAGKVPGAKTTEDVKKHYESMVPMRRGVYPSDIVRAILYAVEQEYETGQAIPVTGGQIMLH